MTPAPRASLADPAVPAAAARYAAFLSYSHELDHALAPVLQRQIEEIARRWPLQRRVVRVFRDESNMAASPDLWGSIEEALGASTWFVLLASPQSAASRWVRDEVTWWLTHRSPQRMLVVVTGGTVAWDPVTNRIDPHGTDAWPPALIRRDLPQPFWIDLREVRDRPTDDPLFRAAAARITAAVRDVDLDRLVGAQLQEHRRRRRIVAIVAVLLLTLVAGVGVAGWTATQQRDRADGEATTATARRLTDAVDAVAADGRFDVARLLAEHAYELRPDERSRAALLTALTANPQVAAFVPTIAPITALAVSADGGEFAVGTSDGTVTVATAAGEVVFTGRAPGPVRVLALDAAGRHVLAGDERGLQQWRRAEPAAPPRTVPVTGPVAAAALSPSGERIGVLEHSGTTQMSILDADMRPRSDLQIDMDVSGPGGPVPSSVRVAFEGEDTVHVAEGPCAHLVVRVAGGVVSERSNTCGMPLGAHLGATSRTGVVGAFYALGGASAVTDATVDEPEQFDLPTGEAELLAVGDERDRVAVVQSGVVTVATHESTLSMTGARGVTAIELLQGSALVVAAEGGAVVFDTRAISPIGRRTGVETPDRIRAVGRPELTMSPSGKHAVVVDEDGVLTVLALPSGTPLPAAPTAGAGSPLLVAWAPDGSSFTTVDRDGRAWRTWRIENDRVVEAPQTETVPDGILRVMDGRGTVVGYRPDGTTTDAVAPPDGTLVSDLAPGGRQAVYAGDHELAVVDLATGQRTATVALTAPGRNLAFPDAGHVLLVQDDGRAVLITLADGAAVDRGSADAGNVDATVAAGRIAATLGLDGRLALADLATGQALGGVDLLTVAPGDAVDPQLTGLALTPDGGTLVTATSGGGVLVWTLDPAVHARLACTSAGHDLTPADWAAFVGTDPPSDLRCGA